MTESIQNANTKDDQRKILEWFVKMANAAPPASPPLDYYRYINSLGSLGKEVTLKNLHTARYMKLWHKYLAKFPDLLESVTRGDPSPEEQMEQFSLIERIREVIFALVDKGTIPIFAASITRNGGGRMIVTDKLVDELNKWDLSLIRRCKFAKCKAPIFLAKRRNQYFCSDTDRASHWEQLRRDDPVKRDEINEKRRDNYQSKKEQREGKKRSKKQNGDLQTQ